MVTARHGTGYGRIAPAPLPAPYVFPAAPSCPAARRNGSTLEFDIRAARIAQHRAMRAVAVRGPKDPVALGLLADAARAAVRAWDAGHRVVDVHPRRTAWGGTGPAGRLSA
ncbi:hypothetical protein [Streptomyces sp. NPDC056045]|uniref:hypothetical protein n=1 Tax=Streptomyces sp. NPDC056045 TaxID=3345691 RepID=UPI0035D5E76E